MTAPPAHASRWALAGGLLAALAAAAFWWPEAPRQLGAPPTVQPAEGVALPTRPETVPPPPVPASHGATAQNTSLPQEPIAADSAGKDPLAAAVAAARAVAPRNPPPGIAEGKSLEEAFAAMQAARGEPSPASAATSPFSRR